VSDPALSSGRWWAVGLVFASALLAACSPAPVEDEASYLGDLNAFRASKDAAFLSPGSPVPPDQQKMLVPLAYFPGSLVYRVPAVLRVDTTRITMEMPTSTGQQRLMQRVGKLEFSLKGQSLTLGAFTEADAPNFDRLFVPFTDLTSGSETYPAGRYLDLDRTRTGIYLIDFNRAYNPYCYYNKTYDCPYPPRENRLQVAIRAGEKMKGGQSPLAPTR
jgi:uncharacterized protein